ncbi:MAG: hypothetical protein HW387_1441, partial [Parachlamydiales bacterium]|nr:hypothetical protein [Parachlamydiales bacterium]
ITIDSPVTINNPGGAGGLLTLTAGNGVFLNADITTDDNHLLITADTITVGDGTVLQTTGIGNMTFNTVTNTTGTGAFTLLATGTGNITVDTLVLGGSSTLSTSGGDISLSTVDGGFDLSLSTGAGDISATGAIGGGTRIGTLSILSAQNAIFQSINAGSVLQTVPATGTTSFAGIVNTNGSGGIDLTGADLTGPLTLQATGTGGITLNNLTLTNPASFSTTTGDISLQAVDGAFDLSLDAGSGNISAAGAIGSVARLSALTVSSANDVSLQDLSVAGDASIAISGTATIGGTMDTSSAIGNGGSASINSSGRNIIVHSVITSGGGAAGNAGAITLQPASGSSSGMPNGRLGIYGNLIANGSGTGAYGDISLSAIGRSGVMKIATIYGNPADSSLNISGNILTLGAYEAITVFGSIAMNLLSAATVGDVIALDALTITAPQINLMLHGSGELLSSSGFLYPTINLHLISRSGAPSLIGSQIRVGTGPIPGFLQFSSLISRSTWRSLLLHSGTMLNFDFPTAATTANSQRIIDIVTCDLFVPLSSHYFMPGIPIDKNNDWAKVSTLLSGE